MHPYIILLLLPLIGIVVFWLLPLPLSIPIYLVILLASGLMYWTIVRAMKKRSKNGVEGLIGAEARVVLDFELAGVIIMFIGFLRTKEVFGLYRFPLIHGFKKVEDMKDRESDQKRVP